VAADPVRHRTVGEKAILKDPTILSAYPHRLVMLYHDTGGLFGEVLAAAEHLEDQGWTVVSHSGGEMRTYVLLRRA